MTAQQRNASVARTTSIKFARLDQFIDRMEASMFVEVGSYDAKTRLPELLRKVEQGERFTITQRGRPIADLVPSADNSRLGAEAAVAAMRATTRVQGVAADELGRWIAEGRR
ncbi:type II toxin-antitoxin system Phd/YefM family antitoxin [Cupriavidus basilensis]|uniref:type II toxin-antitoxin system Phd/YefM family antitoxin n=2 Tax=Cupriavidus TaxID=106589 RepID=UPI001E4AD394|nr:type II toxin-antitoxin system prevent-host-death family antitoxin [Cupriavidus basilensis]